MAERKSGTNATQKSAKSTTAIGKRFKGFTDEERGAMKDRVQEMKAATDKVDGESAVLGSQLIREGKASTQSVTPLAITPRSVLCYLRK